MSELKTRPRDASVEAFLQGIDEDTKRQDAQTLVRIMKRATGAPPKMWGPSIVGFGQYHYRYASGREGDWMLTGFSPRKREFSIYIMAGFDRYERLMHRLGKYRTGKCCLYVRRLADIDLDVLDELVRLSVDYMRETYG